jgi:photosystem II stability/assembly factor-like uncharacterized protein
MNDFDFDRKLEDDLRAELRRTIVPPPAPQYLRERVERMSERASDRNGRRLGFRFLIGRSALALELAGTALVLIVIAVTFVSVGRSSGTGPGSIPTIGPARAVDPAVTPGPTFPALSPVTPHTEISLLDVTADGGVFVSQGDQGMRASLDSGVTWSEVRGTPGNAGVNAVDFVDGLHGWASAMAPGTGTAEVAVYRTSDSGRTWQPAQVGPVTLSVDEVAGSQVHFLDASHGQVWVRILDKTTGTNRCELSTTDDGGVAWSKLSASPCLGTDSPVIWISNALGYTIVGDPAAYIDEGARVLRALVTLDGGRSWKTATLPTDPSEIGFNGTTLVATPGRLRLIAESIPRTGAEWPPRATVFESVDDGTTWSIASSFRVPGQLRALTAVGFDHWVAEAAGMDSNSNQRIETLDGGRTWSSMYGPDAIRVLQMNWWDGQRGVIVGYVPAPCPGLSPVAARSGEAESTGQVYNSCTGGPPSLYVTNDGGRTWHQVPF